MNVGIAKLGMYSQFNWIKIFNNLFKDINVKVYYADETNNLDLLIFDGGADVDPKLYNKPNNNIYPVRARDAQEVELFNKFLDKSTVYAGICRGCQFLNVMKGGTLIQDLPSIGIYHSFMHDVHVIENTQLSKYIQEQTIQVNSIHHQAVEILGDDCIPTLFDNNDIIEGIESLDGKIRAVQCHPEALSFSKASVLLKYLFRIN